jgi:RNA polymerase sigma-70 factor (ECF subfamily)
LEGCRAGKRKSYNLLYQKYSEVMLGICFRYSKNRQEAEDILQEGFIKIFKNISKFRGEGSFEGWMKRIMVNSAIDHYQKSLKHLYHEEVDNVADDNSIVSDQYDDHENNQFSAEQLMQMVQELPDGYRIVFNMFAIEGYSHKDIASHLGISENTSKTQLLKARKTLKAKLETITTTREKTYI